MARRGSFGRVDAGAMRVSVVRGGVTLAVGAAADVSPLAATEAEGIPSSADGVGADGASAAMGAGVSVRRHDADALSAVNASTSKSAQERGA